MEAMHTTDTALKPSGYSACNRRPWACHQLNTMSARTRRRLQRRTRQAGKQASAKQALDTDTATQMRRANENVQEAFASGNPETLKENGDDMMEVKACSLWSLDYVPCLRLLCLSERSRYLCSTCCSMTPSHLHQMQPWTNQHVAMQAYMKQMEAVRKKVLEQPGTLPQLVLQLHQGDTDAQTKAAEMLFCVVGQGPGRDKEATKLVSSFSHTPIRQ